MNHTSIINFRQQRDFSDVLNETFAFFRQNFRPLAKNFLFIIAPFIALETIIAGFFGLTTFLGTAGKNVSTMFAGMFLYYVAFFFTSIILTGFVNGFIVLYMDRGGVHFSTSDINALIKKFFWRLFLSTLIVGMIAGGGMMFFIIPGIFFGVILSPYSIILMRENTGAFNAIGRCFELVLGRWWRTFAVIVVSYFISSVFSLAVQIPQYLLMWFVEFHSTTGNVPDYYRFLISILSFFTGAIARFLLIIPAVAIAFQYFSIVEEKELVGLFERIDRIRQPIADAAVE